MLIVEPGALRFEGADEAMLTEDHLLERISALENRQARLTEKLERALDLLLRQAQNAHFDRGLVKALVGLLTVDGVIEKEQLEQNWIDLCQKDAEEEQASDRREELRLKILGSYRGTERKAFEQWINEGFLFIDDAQLSRGMRSLQRASELPNPNVHLLYFVGVHYFRKGKTARALEYLSRAHDVSPDDKRVSLLLGLTCADEGDIERAKELLSSAMRLGGSSFAAHYGLGRLFVAEEKWRMALQEFKLALASKASPEAHYALGCLYYQIGRDSLAGRHLRKALEMDVEYGEAYYVLGLMSQRAGREEQAADYFAKAGTRSLGRSKAAAKKKSQNEKDFVTAPLFRPASGNQLKLMTGGDRRLAEALRNDALTAADA